MVVGVTGASGAIYAHRLTAELLRRGAEVFLAASSAGRQVIQEEIPELAGPADRIFARLPPGELRIFHEKDLFAPFCSGSFAFHGMAVVPASMGTIGALASGCVSNCIHRGAEVALKEKRPLVLVPRETPLSAIHLENLLRLARAGAVILPPMPAFYQHPRTIGDQVDFVVSRVLDHLGFDNDLFPRWTERP